jgi:hypothetical protein
MNIANEWKKSGFTAPKVMTAYNNSGEKFIVIEDDTTIIKLINKNGQIYVVAAFRCQYDKTRNAYLCGDPIHPISCSKIDNPKERFGEKLIQYI